MFCVFDVLTFYDPMFCLFDDRTLSLGFIACFMLEPSGFNVLPVGSADCYFSMFCLFMATAHSLSDILLVSCSIYVTGAA